MKEVRYNTIHCYASSREDKQERKLVICLHAELAVYTEWDSLLWRELDQISE